VELRRSAKSAATPKANSPSVEGSGTDTAALTPAPPCGSCARGFGALQHAHRHNDIRGVKQPCFRSSDRNGAISERRKRAVMTKPVATTSPELSIKVVLLLAAAVFINFVDRGNLATASPLLKDWDGGAEPLRHHADSRRASRR